VTVAVSTAHAIRRRQCTACRLANRATEHVAATRLVGSREDRLTLRFGVCIRLMNMSLILVCIFISSVSCPGVEALTSKAEMILTDLDKQVKAIRLKTIALLEKEMTAEAKKGNLEAALAIKNEMDALKNHLAESRDGAADDVYTVALNGRNVVITFKGDTLAIEVDKKSTTMSIPELKKLNHYGGFIRSKCLSKGWEPKLGSPLAGEHPIHGLIIFLFAHGMVLYDGALPIGSQCEVMYFRKGFELR